MTIKRTSGSRIVPLAQLWFSGPTEKVYTLRRLHVSLEDSDLLELLDRIMDRGLAFEPTLLISLLQTGTPEQVAQVTVQSVQTNTSSYAQLDRPGPYRRMRKTVLPQ